MQIENTQLTISRVEIIKRVFNAQNQIVEERIEYYHPTEQEHVVGFHIKKKK